MSHVTILNFKPEASSKYWHREREDRQNTNGLTEFEEKKWELREIKADGICRIKY